MRIVDVSGFYSPSGSGVRSNVHRKFEAAAKLGHDITVVAPGAEDRVDERPGGRIVWVASPLMPFDSNYRMFWDAAAVWRAMDPFAPDVVEGSSPWRGGWIAGCWRAGDPTFKPIRSLLFYQDVVAGYGHTLLDGVLARPTIDRLSSGYWAYLRRLSRRFDVTVTGGDWLAARLAEFGIHRPVAVPLGVDANSFSPDMRDAALRRELLATCGVGLGCRLLLALGRFHPEKRHKTIIRVFAAAKSRKPDIGLLIVGDGLARSSVAREARRAGCVPDRRRTRPRPAGAPLCRRRRPGPWIRRGDLRPCGRRGETVGPVSDRPRQRRGCGHGALRFVIRLCHGRCRRLRLCDPARPAE